MTKYCITAANHTNPKNHCASQFKVWEHEFNPDTKKWTWAHLGKKSLHYIVGLLQDGHEVITGKENEKTITPGKPVEIELRIAKNETEFPISGMPTF